MDSSPPTFAAAPATVRAHLPHIPELDGIRGLAALAVFCHHLLYTSLVQPESADRVVATAAYLSRAGMFGVDIFFVLSGYLITSILLLDRDRPHYYKNFYWKRALRIFPLYIVSLVCIAVFMPDARRYVVLAALFLGNFAQVFHVPADGPFWTLAIEEQFYLVWPQCARRLTVARLRQIALALAGCCLLLRLIAAALGHHDFRFTFFHCDGLALGAVLASGQNMSPLSRGPGDGNRKRSGWLLPVAAVLPSVLLAFVSPETRAGMAMEAVQVTGVSVLGFVAVRYAVEHTGATVLAALRSRVLTFFGLISYCLYMSHLYVMSIWDAHFGAPLAARPGQLAVRFLGVLAVTVVVCVVSRYVLELPAMKLRRYVLGKA